MQIIKNADLIIVISAFFPCFFIKALLLPIFIAIIFILIPVLATIWLAFGLLFDINHRCLSCGSCLTYKYKKWYIYANNPHYFFCLNRFCLKCKRSQWLKLIKKKEISLKQISKYTWNSFRNYKPLIPPGGFFLVENETTPDTL